MIRSLRVQLGADGADALQLREEPALGALRRLYCAAVRKLAGYTPPPDRDESRGSAAAVAAVPVLLDARGRVDVCRGAGGLALLELTVSPVRVGAGAPVLEPMVPPCR